MWTKPAVWSAGRDPLGMQATSVRLYRRLAPGLTNVTNRLRYFSFYCWAVDAYERQIHSGDLRRWQIFIRRAEAIYALASNLVDGPQSLGMAGGDWANRMKAGLSASADWDIFELGPHTDRPGEAGQYLKAKSGNFGQFYVASMLEVGMLSEFMGIPIVSEGYGRELARSFSNSIGAAEQGLLDGIVSGSISRAALNEIGVAAHPARIPRDSEEMALLRAYLLGERNQVGGSELQRRSSAWLRLELMNRGIGASDDASMRKAFYARVAPDGSPIDITGDTIDGWRAYQANEFGHISLECLLNGLIACLNDFGGAASPEAAIDALLELKKATGAARAAGSYVGCARPRGRLALVGAGSGRRNGRGRLVCSRPEGHLAGRRRRRRSLGKGGATAGRALGKVGRQSAWPDARDLARSRIWRAVAGRRSGVQQQRSRSSNPCPAAPRRQRTHGHRGAETRRSGDFHLPLPLGRWRNVGRSDRRLRLHKSASSKPDEVPE